ARQRSWFSANFDVDRVRRLFFICEKLGRRGQLLPLQRMPQLSCWPPLQTPLLLARLSYLYFQSGEGCNPGYRLFRIYEASSSIGQTVPPSGCEGMTSA